MCYRIVKSVKSSSCPIWSCLRAVLVILFGRTIQRSIAITELTNNLKPIVYKYNSNETIHVDVPGTQFIINTIKTTY